MRRPRRRTAGALGAVVVGAVLVVGAGVGIPASGGDPATDAATGSTSAAAVRGSDVRAGADSEDAAKVIAAAQARLKQVPGDAQAWAGLGLAYVQQARVTADPSYYPKAQGALDKSMKLQPEGNAAGLGGLATLAAARHDFSQALDLATQAEAADPYSSTVEGAKGDALIELGRYDEAYQTFQKMVDLKPGVPAYTRASYAWELRGDTERATSAMQMALDAAYSPADQAFALYYLGQLSWNNGDLAAAAEHYAEGLRRNPDYLPLLAGKAQVEAARGDTKAAVADYATVTQRLPQAKYLIEYADLLASLGRDADAQQQYALVDVEEKLFEAQGVLVDLELANYDADHGQPTQALTEASAVYQRRQTILTEDAYGWALHVNGRDDEALPHAQQAVRLGYHDASLYFHKGMIEKALGDNGAARADLSKALELNPQFSPLRAPIAVAALASLGGAE